MNTSPSFINIYDSTYVIFGSQDNREIFIAYLENIIAGVNNQGNSSLLYFEN